MSKMVNPCRVITGKDTRFSYLIVNEPKAINGGTPKYNICNAYKKQKECTSHYVQENELVEIVAQGLMYLFLECKIDKKELRKKLTKAVCSAHEEQVKMVNKRISEIDTALKNAFIKIKLHISNRNYIF